MVNVTTNQAFLIDFGFAARNDDTLKGFRGTTLYAHSFMFGKYPRKEWKSKPEYDYTSLALSMAVLSKGGKCPWKQIAPDRSDDDFKRWVKERSLTAWKCLRAGGFADADWKKWCEESE
jgi:hypothetical protein